MLPFCPLSSSSAAVPARSETALLSAGAQQPVAVSLCASDVSFSNCEGFDRLVVAPEARMYSRFLPLQTPLGSLRPSAAQRSTTPLSS